MNLLILGSPIASFAALPEIKHAYVWVDDDALSVEGYEDSLTDFLRVAEDEDVPVSIFIQDAATLAEEILDSVVSVDESDTYPGKKFDNLRDLTDGDAIACLAWSGSDPQYEMLEFLQSRGVSVLDMNDHFAEMKIGETPDLDHIIEAVTQRVTAEVLRVVRAEMREMMSARRWRSTAKKA